MVQCFGEPWTGGGAAGDFVFEDPAAASRCEGSALELGVLSVGGDAGVTDEIEMLGCQSTSVAQPSHNIAVLSACCETGCGRFGVGASPGPETVSEPAVSGQPVVRRGSVSSDHALTCCSVSRSIAMQAIVRTPSNVP